MATGGEMVHRASSKKTPSPAFFLTFQWDLVTEKNCPPAFFSGRKSQGRTCLENNPLLSAIGYRPVHCAPIWAAMVFLDDGEIPNADHEFLSRSKG
jgi:hypothetical protein